MFDVGLNRAVAALAEKAAKGGGRRGAPAALKTLGDHPDGGPVTVHSGRYGPYVKWAKINATIPKGTEPEAVTMEQALELIAARAEKTGKKAPAKKKTAARKTTTKKASAKKAPAKKKAASAE
mgnify:CR=1 FL=1